MVTITVESVYVSADPLTTSGITDLELIETADGPVLAALSVTEPGVLVLDAAAAGMSEVSTLALSDGPAASALTPQLSVLTVDGQEYVVPVGMEAASLSGYALSGATLSTKAKALPASSSVASLFLDGADEFATAGFDHDQITDFMEIDIGGQTMVLTLFGADGALASYRLDSSGAPVFQSLVGASEGLAMGGPTAMASTTFMGQTYVVVASSISSSISVAILGADGSLTATDHVIDTLDTRFANASAIDVLTVGSRCFVVVGGSDGGFSLFELLPSGTLYYLASQEDTADTTLQAVSALVLAEDAGALTVYAASSTEPGVSAFHIALDPVGPIQDAAGSETLTGSAGEDAFFLLSDGQLDTITDFDPLHDTVDLSLWPMLFDPAALSIVEAGTSLIVSHGNETLVVEFANGSPNAALFQAAVVIGPSHALYPAPDTGTSGPTVATGTAGNDTLVGGAGDDTLQGLGGNDRLEGSAGDDRLEGGTGNDGLLGHSGNDTILGGNGHDTISASDGDDRVLGGSGSDQLGGGDGRDTLLGEAGNDIIGGGNDADYIALGDGHDVASGGTGNDTVLGEAGNDTLAGSYDNDSVVGGDGDDDMGGGPGQDTLLGGNGNDSLGGGYGPDIAYGQAGDDFVATGGGADTLSGGDGADRLNGGTGDDRLTGGAGADEFVFSEFLPGETDVITDFEDGVDVIHFIGALPRELTYSTNAAGDAVITHESGHQIVLIGITPDQLSMADFGFF